jgi:hypothetical protein
VHLGVWLARQRRLHRAGNLPDDIADALNALGVDWNPAPRRPAPPTRPRPAAQAGWERGLRAAAQFAARHGHTKVPSGHTENGLRLDAWLARQRKAHREDRLTPEQQHALTALGITPPPDTGTAPLAP